QRIIVCKDEQIFDIFIIADAGISIWKIEGGKMSFQSILDYGPSFMRDNVAERKMEALQKDRLFRRRGGPELR
ncbi:hypothetical protein PFISCL1PPCAC_20822, partial [Pristionchus fissidentatus]